MAKEHPHLERLRRAVHDRFGKRPSAASVMKRIDAAERETPPVDYTVPDRPDTLDHERACEVYRRAASLLGVR